MKSNEITVGQDYAVTTYGIAKDGLYSDFLSQATVVEVLGKGHFLARVAGYKSEHNLRSVQIIGSWDEYTKGQADKRAAEKARKARTTAAAKSLKTFVPADIRLPWWTDGTIYGDGSYAKEGKITVAELAALLEAAYNHGKSEA